MSDIFIFAMNEISRKPNNAAKFLGLLLVLLVTTLAINASAAQSRFALVDGNSAYIDGKLKKPVNDTDLLTSTLESKGFRVTTIKTVPDGK